MIQVQELLYLLPQTQRRLVYLSSLTLVAGAVHVLLGANGAGKSSLLRCLCGDVPALHHAVSFAGRCLNEQSVMALARCRAVLPQLTEIPFAFSVRAIVAFGREVYRGETAEQYDTDVLDTVMAWLDITHLADMNYQQLSGGEQQRVQIARTLAQVIPTPDAPLDGKILFLDEPTNHLDIRHQYRLLEQLATLKARGLTIVCVLHDIMLALNYADTLLLLHEGESLGHFTPKSLVDSAALTQAYGLDLQAHWSEQYGRYLVIPQRQ